MFTSLSPKAFNMTAMFEKVQNSTSALVLKASGISYADRRQSAPPQYSEYSMPMNNSLYRPIVTPRKSNYIIFST